MEKFQVGLGRKLVMQNLGKQVSKGIAGAKVLRQE